MRLGLEHDEPLSRKDPEAALSLNGNGAPAASGVVERVLTDLTTIEIGDIKSYAQDLSSLDGAEPAEPGRRLFIRGEIARGGMGIVLLGHDTELGRDIAVKVLQDKHRDHPAMVDRFVAEARIAGQLQHPGVVPVHELGMLADRRPFFTMKLVRGSTLAEMLAGRSLPSSDRAGFLRIFLHVAETIGYAHERSVIHRDLKPSNIMVGRHGEVMVMDWGLAKVSTPPGGLRRRRAHRNPTAPAAPIPACGCAIVWSWALPATWRPSSSRPKRNPSTNGQTSSRWERF